VRFCFVTPRYGAEISSGAEHGCRLLAEQLADRHDVEVLTTTARHPQTWKNDYAEGTDKIRGVLVRRFSVSQPHDAGAFTAFSRQLQETARSRHDELEWVRRLGPWSPGLLEHLRRQHRSYDALVFFSLHHATTVHGLQVAPDRSILFPYLQLTPALRFALWGELLRMPSAIGLFSAAERRLLRGYVRCTTTDDEVVGIGIEPSHQQAYPRHQQDPADAPVREDEEAVDAGASQTPAYLDGRGVPFRRRHRLYGPLALYGGRVESDNGCEEMLEYFDSYSAANGDTTLALMGVKMMKVPDERNVRQAGVLPDRERMAAFEAADVTVAPAADDLLGEPLLESMAVGTPVLANARNAAAVEHCRRGGGGLYYANRDEFVEALRLLMTNARMRERLGESGRQYVRTQYRWEAVLGRFERLVGKVRKSG
jgi:glycosyltransferase involved in cell wall biosynthesis